MDKTAIPLLEATKLKKTYQCNRKILHAVKDVDFTLQRGETLGVVGESGCGKSTLGRVVLGLENLTAGQIRFCGQDINSTNKATKFLFRQKMQMIFQDPYTSLNPRMTVEDIIGEGLDIHQLAKGADRRHCILELLAQINLEPGTLTKYPHEFSGGQRQRIGIARALAVNPEFLVCDEPLSALDACTQQRVMEMLIKLKEERGLTYLFISHDLHAVRQIANRIAVMYLGKIVELAPSREFFNLPAHPYSEALLSAIPIADPIQERKRSRIILKGEIPSPLNPPGGCPFHPRCPKAQAICKTTPPDLLQIGVNPERQVACHFPF